MVLDATELDHIVELGMPQNFTADGIFTRINHANAILAPTFHHALGEARDELGYQGLGNWLQDINVGKKAIGSGCHRRKLGMVFPDAFLTVQLHFHFLKCVSMAIWSEQRTCPGASFAITMLGDTGFGGASAIISAWSPLGSHSSCEEYT